MPINDDLSVIDSAANTGAFGVNDTPLPTVAMLEAGNYKKGKFRLNGIVIAIENPRFTWRKGIDANGKEWSNQMMAHYGYIQGTHGNDGDELDVFVGAVPESKDVFIINQVHKDGTFDEHKIMLCFDSQESAIKAYQYSYDKNWKGLDSVVPATFNQFVWWLNNGHHKQPLKPKHLPYAGLESVDMNVTWNSQAEPVGLPMNNLLYSIRVSDKEGLLNDPVAMDDINAEISRISSGGIAMDALITPFNRLEKKMTQLRGAMERVSKGQTVVPLAMQISEPFKRNGTVNVAVLFELSDGQTITMWLHNPDSTPLKLLPTDELVSWKWLLNKKDVTIVVAPEKGTDLKVIEVARRLMKIAEKNSAAFIKANTNRAAKLEGIATLKKEAMTVEADLEQVNLTRQALAAELNSKEIQLAELKRANNAKQAENSAIVSNIPDYKTPEGYALILQDLKQITALQDGLDAFFQARIVEVQGELQSRGWERKKGNPFMFTSAISPVTLEFNFKKVGAGGNVYGYDVMAMNEVTRQGLAVGADDLTLTPTQYVDKMMKVAIDITGQNVTAPEGTTQPVLDDSYDTKYSIGRSKYNSVYVKKIREEDGAPIFFVRKQDTGIGTRTMGDIAEVYDWLADSMFVGGGTWDKVKKTLKLVEGDDLLKINGEKAENAKPPTAKQLLQQKAQDAMVALNKIQPFLPKSQYSALRSAMNGEEKEAFFDKVISTAEIIATMPVTYEQDGLGDAAIVNLHYFTGNSDWYITEKDKSGRGTEQAFGYAILNGDTDNAELGYISINELTSIGAELDLYWDSKTLGQIKGEPQLPPVDDALAERLRLLHAKLEHLSPKQLDLVAENLGYGNALMSSVIIAEAKKEKPDDLENAINYATFTPAPKPVGELILDELVKSYGWRVSVPNESLYKEFSGMPIEGELGGGILGLSASLLGNGRWLGIDDNSRETGGFHIPETEYDTRDILVSRDAPLGAKAFNDLVEDYVSKKRFEATTPKNSQQEAEDALFARSVALDARIDALSPEQVGLLSKELGYKKGRTATVEKAKLEHPDDLEAALAKVEAATYVPAPVPVPTPPVPVDAQRETDIRFVKDVIAGSADMFSNTTGERIDAMFDTYADDAEIQALLDESLDALSSATKARSSKVNLA